MYYIYRMYIRKISKKNGVTKKSYQYLHLVENIRTSAGPRQKLILNLGNIDIHESQFKTLAKRIEDILTGQKSFIQVDENINKYAKKAKKIKPSIKTSTIYVT